MFEEMIHRSEEIWQRLDTKLYLIEEKVDSLIARADRLARHHDSSDEERYS
jgi:hypothetical protein